MMKVKDIFPLGTMLSVTITGNGEGISNGTRLVDGDGNIIVVESVAMTRHNDPADIKNDTTIFIKRCDLKIGCELSIA